MPFEGNRIYLITAVVIGAIIAIIIGAGIAASSQPPPANSPPRNSPSPTQYPKTLTFTITAGVGAQQIKITNLNTPATIILTQSDFPATLNCNSGDVLTFNVLAKEGYSFNAWLIDDGTWQSKNPLTLKTSSSFSMEAAFLINDVEVTQQP